MTDPCACPDGLAGPVGEADDTVTVPVVRLDQSLPLPSYAQHGDAGLDLLARAEVSIGPGQRALVPTGVAVALPPGYAGFVHPRSGLAARHGISVVNAPGTVDSGYRGEIMVNLVNHDPETSFTVRRSDRIAQLVVQRVAHAHLVEVDSLDRTPRGETGYGSTGGFGSAHDTQRTE